jgi:hypothetical protein
MIIPASISPVGSLEALPLEVLQSILNLLDLQCLTDFRAVSWRARALVDSVPQYNTLVQHCPDALRAFLSTGMAVHFSASQIFEALCTQDCIDCGLFGPLLDLFTAHRYCIICVSSSYDLFTVAVSTASRDFGLGLETMHTMPKLLTVPWDNGRLPLEGRVSLVRIPSASVAQPPQEFNSIRSRPPPPPTEAPPQPSHSHSLSFIHRWRLNDQPQRIRRLMSMLKIPFLDRRTGDLDWGVSCRACCIGPRDESRGYRDCNTVYSTSGYMEHFQKCELSQRGRAEISKCFGEGERISDDQLYQFFRLFEF